MQILEFSDNSLRFLDAVPEEVDSGHFFWIYLDREDFAQHLEVVQQAAQKLGGSRLLDVHVEDLQNAQHPSHYDFTSVYDRVIFRRLSMPSELQAEQAVNKAQDGKTARPHHPRFAYIDSRAVGFVVFDRLLISTHARGCYAARSFVQRFLQDAKHSVDVGSARSRIPSNPADLTLRMLNMMVDSYLELRKDLTQQLEHWQQQLLSPRSRFNDWGAIIGARNQLHVLEDLCDEQHDAIQEWLDAMMESPLSAWSADMQQAQQVRDQHTTRARDVIEHISRVMHHARRLEQSAETVVQIHFSAQSNRTNDIMRTLTALTAIFLPLNLIAGIFGMNFEFLPLIHAQSGFWWALGSMALTALGLGLLFWRKRYLARTRA
jgi:magnesium transporter